MRSVMMAVAIAQHGRDRDRQQDIWWNMVQDQFVVAGIDGLSGQHKFPLFRASNIVAHEGAP